MKKSIIMMIGVLISASVLFAGNNKEPKGYWAFDNVRSELRELKMVRGETFLPKERYGLLHTRT